MGLNKNQTANLFSFVILILILVVFGFCSTIGWSDSYIVTVLSGGVGVVLGIVIRFLLVEYVNSNPRLAGFGLALAIVVPLIGFYGVGVIAGVVEAELVNQEAIGNGAYAGILVISAFTTLFGFDFSQLEESG